MQKKAQDFFHRPDAATINSTPSHVGTNAKKCYHEKLRFSNSMIFETNFYKICILKFSGKTWEKKVFYSLINISGAFWISLKIF